MKGFFGALIATACFVLPVQAEDQGRQFQHIRVLGFELINNVLAFYNPNSEGMDYRFQQRYQDAFNILVCGNRHGHDVLVTCGAKH